MMFIYMKTFRIAYRHKNSPQNVCHEAAICVQLFLHQTGSERNRQQYQAVSLKQSNTVCLRHPVCSVISS